MLTLLTGFMCAGKTTLGSALAARLGYCFVDLDKIIEQQTQCIIPELFAHKGEPEFRQIEQQVLFDTVAQLGAQRQDAIIACGGGAPCYQDNLAFMKAHGFVIYLEVPPETLCERLISTPAEARPLLPYRDPATLLHHIRNLLAKRKPYYEAAHWKC